VLHHQVLRRKTAFGHKKIIFFILVKIPAGKLSVLFLRQKIVLSHLANTFGLQQKRLRR
jgi:hypothetical protein